MGGVSEVVPSLPSESKSASSRKMKAVAAERLFTIGSIEAPHENKLWQTCHEVVQRTVALLLIHHKFLSIGTLRLPE